MSTHGTSLLEHALADTGDDATSGDETVDRVLAAAAEQFGTAGIQRSTMEDVARRAGVSRITVYRRFATKDELVVHVVRREFRRYFDQFLLDIADAETAADRVVAGFVSSLRAARANPLIGGLLSSEPDSVLPTLVSDGGRTLAAVRAFVAGQLRREQDAGAVASGIDVDLAAEMMVRVTASFLGIPSQIVDLDDEQQLAKLARTYLVPLLQPPGSSR